MSSEFLTFCWSRIRMVAKLLKINMLLLRAHDFSSDFSPWPGQQKRNIGTEKSENLWSRHTETEINSTLSVSRGLRKYIVDRYTSGRGYAISTGHTPTPNTFFFVFCFNCVTFYGGFFFISPFKPFFCNCRQSTASISATTESFFVCLFCLLMLGPWDPREI